MKRYMAFWINYYYSSWWLGDLIWDFDTEQEAIKNIEQDREKNKKEEYYIYDLQKDLRYSIIPLV